MIFIDTLVVVAHPQLDNSQTQQFLKQGALQVNAKWHYISEIVQFDVEEERTLLLNAQRIILQFPLYWYAAPESLKRWQDQVLSSNFVKNNLAQKQLGVVVSTGLPQKDFGSGQKVGFSLDQILTPYQALANQAQMQWLPPFGIYQFYYLSEKQQMQLLMDYQRFLDQNYPDNLINRSHWYQQRLQEFAVDDHTELIQSVFQQTTQELENSMAVLQMISDGEDDSLE